MRALVTLSASLVAIGVASSNAAMNASPRGGCADLRAPRFRVPSRFLAPRSTGLWMPSGSRCLFRIVAGARSVEPVFRLRPGERLVGLHWAPGGRSFVVVTRQPRRVVRLAADGRILGSWRARTAAFLSDGRLVLGFDSGLSLAQGRSLRLLARRAALARAAGFPSASGPFGPDPWGYSRGYGNDAVALQWWSGQRDVMLVAGVDGSVKRASPSLRGYGSVGGSAWTPDGRRLLEFTVFHSPAGFHKDHDHCLDVWSERGIQHAFCISRLAAPYRFHFDKLLWSTDGRTGLLNDGTVISARGRVLGLAQGAGDPAFAVVWQPS